MEELSCSTNQCLRDEQAKYAARALFAAATMSAIRAVILPWLIAHSPPGTFPGIDGDAVQLVGVGQALLFAGLAVWARKDPLSATVAAIVFYLGMAAPDLMNNTGFLAKGLISKFVMLLILARALLAGILHRVK